ncbi:MAG TPA: nucleotide pyrophosphohydrolase [Candidatus Lokiarchaeia archaeon]|nr:nucleotide pyrophosphohydrolase [Candidatus Lokiarchaeia archaeon]
MDESVNVADLKEEVQKFVHERKWESYHTPKDLSIALSIEAAELMEHFLFKDHSTEEIVEDSALLEKIGDEIADIFIYLLSLVNTLGVDLSDLFIRKMEKNRKKYPAEEFQGNYTKR